MVTPDPFSAYRRNQVTTVPPEKVVLLLYDGALRSLNRGVEAMERRDIQNTNHQLCRAQEIVAHLLAALDREVGGSLADNLAGLYNYVLRRLVQANVEKDVSAVRETIRLLSELREGWQGALVNGSDSRLAVNR